MNEKGKDHLSSNPFMLPTTIQSSPASTSDIFGTKSASDGKTNPTLSIFPSTTVSSQSLYPKMTPSIFGGSVSSIQNPFSGNKNENIHCDKSPGHLSPPPSPFGNKVPFGYRIPKISPPKAAQDMRTTNTESYSAFGGHASVLSHSHPPPGSNLSSSPQHSRISQKPLLSSQSSSSAHPQPVMSSSIVDTKRVTLQPTNIFDKKSNVPQIFGGKVSHTEVNPFSMSSKEGSSTNPRKAAPSYDDLFSSAPKKSSFPLFERKIETSKKTDFLSAKIEPVFQKKEQPVILNPIDSPIVKVKDIPADILEIIDSDSDSDIREKATKSEPKTSSELILNTLIAIDVPKDYLNRHILMNHFEKFGKVSKVVINKKSSQASIFFLDSDSASEAKAKGQVLHPLVPKLKLLFRPQPIKKVKSISESPKPSTLQTSLKSIVASTSSAFSEKRPKLSTYSQSVPTSSSISTTAGIFKSTAKFAKVKPVIKTKESISSIRKSSLSPSGKVKPLLKKNKISSSNTLTKESVVKSINTFIGSESKDKKKSNIEEMISSRPSASSHILSTKNLSEKVHQRALNNEDQYQILDARDKLLRTNMKKTSEFSEAKYLSATCPDMCPEKERYARERQCDISIYEMTGSELDHKLAVKKFSRSSADKDEPLPHELRPSKALKISMDHLICNVMSLQDDPATQVDIWYNYLWNRTRALRNDIMQQHLIDSTAINVLEKCLRFHIHCGYHLCEENLEMFDPRMNAEHLTKSLQSLKELYHDLSEKNIFFDTEAEMRTYEILLNIFDGNIILNYINFREPVQNSPDVQFAISILHSVQANNYVKFFELASKASYLQSCILHTHFNRVRKNAMKTIIKAYTIPNNPQSLSLSKLCKMLGFVDTEEAITYLGQFSIHPDSSNDVIIDRQKLSLECDNILPTRKTKMITYLPSPITNIIEDGPLPINPHSYYVPHNSFDDSGYLKQTAKDASDQNIFLSPPRPSVRYDSLQTKDLESCLAMKVKEMHELRLLRKYLMKWKDFTQVEKKVHYMKEKRKWKLAQKIVVIWKMKTEATQNKKKKADLVFLAKCFHRWNRFTKVSKELKALKNVVEITLQKQIAKKYFRIWKAKAEIRKKLRILYLLKCQFLARKFFDLWKRRTREQLMEKEAIRFYNLKILKSYFFNWKKWICDEKYARRIDHEAFPSAGAMLSVEKQNRLLDWNYGRDSSMNMSAKQYLELSDDIQIKLKSHFLVNKLSDIMAWSTLQLKDHFLTDLDNSSTSRNIFERSFKLLLVIDDSLDCFFLEWIRNKFNFSASSISTPLYCVDYLKSSHSGSFCHIIVKEVAMSQDFNSIDGASAIIVAVQKENLSKAKELLKPYEWMPHIILCWNNVQDSIKDRTWYLHEESLQEASSSERLMQLTLEFWKNRSVFGELQQTKLSNFISGLLSDVVLVPLCKLIEQKKDYDDWVLPLAEIINFFNEVLHHLIKYVDSIKFPNNNWPPSEINDSANFPPKYWERNQKKKILQCLNSLYLPEFTLTHGKLWDKIVAEISQYLSLVVGDDTWGEDLKIEVSRMLSKAQQSFNLKKDVYNLELDEADVYFEIPWLDVFTSFIFYKFSLLPDMEVYIDKPKDYIPRMVIEIGLARVRHSLVHFSPNERATIYTYLTPKRKANLDTEEEPFSKVKKINEEFDEALEKEERESKDFLKALQELLSEEKEAVLSMKQRQKP